MSDDIAEIVEDAQLLALTFHMPQVRHQAYAIETPVPKEFSGLADRVEQVGLSGVQRLHLKRQPRADACSPTMRTASSNCFRARSREYPAGTKRDAPLPKTRTDIPSRHARSRAVEA